MPISDRQLEIVLAKLVDQERRFAEIESQMHDPAVASDQTRLVPLSKEYARLSPVVAQYRQYLAIRKQAADAEQLARDASAEAEMRQLAKAETEELSAKSDELMESILDALLVSDQPAIDSAIIEIRAGTGGQEAALFAGDLLTLYEKYALKHRYKTEVLSLSTTDLGGLREVLLEVKGPDAYRRLQFEAGVHRVQRVPVTEAQGRIHTSTATVAVLPEVEEFQLDIKPEDVREDVSRAGGPGGQNVNKVASAIRLTHIPTGFVVSMRDERSQHKNRDKAWRVLRSRLYEHFQGIERAQRAATRKSMVRQRRPQREDSHLQLPAESADRPPHRPGHLPPGRDHGQRRPGRVHRRVAPDGPRECSGEFVMSSPQAFPAEEASPQIKQISQIGNAKRVHHGGMRTRGRGDAGTRGHGDGQRYPRLAATRSPPQAGAGERVRDTPPCAATDSTPPSSTPFTSAAESRTRPFRGRTAISWRASDHACCRTTGEMRHGA